MRFRFVRPVDHPVQTYQGKTVSTGDEIEFDAFFSGKARNNPDFEAVEDERKPRARSKKKVSRRGQDQG